MAAVARADPSTRDCVSRMAVVSGPDATPPPPVAKRRRAGMQISHMFLAMLEDVGDEILETEAAPVTGVLAPDFSAVGGFRDLMLVAKLTGTAVEELFSDVVALGVVEVAERPTWRSWTHARSSVHLRPAVWTPRASHRVCEWRLAPRLQLASS